LVGDDVLRVNGLQAGRASLRITETSTGETRYLGVRVRTASGEAPGMPEYVAIGSVSEDRDHDLNFWRDFDDDLTNKRMDIRYIYINGGPFTGWRTWTTKDGARAITYVRESLKLGMIPFFVYYNIPDDSENFQVDKEHIESVDYMEAYYQDLKFFLDLVREEAGDEVVGIVLEPDFLGYMMQQSGGTGQDAVPVPPDELLAQTNAAYSSGVLDAGADPVFPDSVTGLVQSINYVIDKYLPNAYFGWQFNLWASPGITVEIPGSGLIRLTDSLGWEDGRAAIAAETEVIADYYLDAGVATNGADFVSIDKYGLDAGASGWQDPANSTWFWNADHWNNYLLFSQVLGQQSNLPVILWQIPVGHVNDSQTPDPYDGGLFEPLDNSSQHYEDSAPTFFLGDTFKPGSSRLSYFATNEAGDPKVSVSGDAVTWGEHVEDARDHGIVAILFGAGVGGSTDGVGSPPTDDYWWITKVQEYFESPVPLN
jgi:hypothetical protein